MGPIYMYRLYKKLLSYHLILHISIVLFGDFQSLYPTAITLQEKESLSFLPSPLFGAKNRRRQERSLPDIKYHCVYDEENGEQVMSLIKEIKVPRFILRQVYGRKEVSKNSSLTLRNIRYHSIADTLNTIARLIEKKEKGIYLRFGDGDALLAAHKNDSYQDAHDDLQREMQEAFALNGPTILKSFPLHCKELGSYEEGMQPGVGLMDLSWCLKYVTMINDYWCLPITDIYSSIALQFSATHKQDLCINFLKFLKESKPALLVGNCAIAHPLRSLLFGDECAFVPTNKKNAYDDIDRIEQECLASLFQAEGSDYKVIIMAMGCSGRVLAKRLWQKLDNIFIFDFGSLMDALSYDRTRAWMNFTYFDAAEFLQKLRDALGDKKIIHTKKARHNAEPF